MLSAVEKKSDQVYRWLLAYIDENKFSGNQRLPSENALCRKLGVSRETIRVAIDRLVNEGIVYKIKGSGTYFHREKVMTRDLNTEGALYKIGLILQGQDTSANSGLIEGVRSVLTQERVDLHVFLTDNKFCNERRCLETVVHQNFHGFIVDGVKSSILSPNLDCYKELYRRKIPVIFYNNFYRNLRCPRVTINDIECAHQLIGRLIDAGHSNIAGIFVYDNYQSVEKFQGMAEAMRSRGLDLNDDYIKWCISDEAHNERYVRSIERFLKSIPKCTAIVCCNYIIYRLVMKTLQKMGKTVPEDYSLVCFDYSEETYRQEDVTCSVEQGFEMGRQLALRLMRRPKLHLCHEAHSLRWSFHLEDHKGKIKVLPEAVLLSGRISLSVLLCQKACSSLQARKRIGKELTICSAEAVTSSGIPVAPASAPAERLIRAGCTFRRAFSPLFQKHPAYGRVQCIFDGTVAQISQLPLIQNIKVTGIKASIAFHCEIMSTGA